MAIALAGNRISRRLAGLLAAGSVGVSFVAAAYAFAELLTEDPEERVHVSTLWTWLSAGDLSVGFDILVDPLSVFMMLVVSGVGFLILSYAVGYMKGDDEERRYHAYKALFVFSMLLLVQAGNLLFLLAGWGMVGLSSYLLINFWHQRTSAVQAGKKAFIMNAFGDATFAHRALPAHPADRPRSISSGSGPSHRSSSISRRHRRRSSRSASSGEPSRSRPRCRSTRGFRMRWRARRRSPPSSTRRRW